MSADGVVGAVQAAALRLPLAAVPVVDVEWSRSAGRQLEAEPSGLVEQVDTSTSGQAAGFDAVSAADQAQAAWQPWWGAIGGQVQGQALPAGRMQLHSERAVSAGGCKWSRTHHLAALIRGLQQVVVGQSWDQMAVFVAGTAALGDDLKGAIRAAS